MMEKYIWTHIYGTCTHVLQVYFNILTIKIDKREMARY